MAVRFRQTNTKQRTIDTIPSQQAIHNTLTSELNKDVQIRKRNYDFQIDALLFPKQASNGSLENQTTSQTNEQINDSLINVGKHEQIEQLDKSNNYLPVPPARPQKGKEGFIRFKGKQQNSSDLNELVYKDIKGGRQQQQKRMRILQEDLQSNSIFERAENAENQYLNIMNNSRNNHKNHNNSSFVRHLSSESKKPSESQKNSYKVITGRDTLNELRTLRRKTSLSTGDKYQYIQSNNINEGGLPVQAGSAILPRGESYLFEQFKASDNNHSSSILKQQSRQFSSVIQKRRFRQELQGNNSQGRQLNYLSAQASPPLLMSYGQRQQQSNNKRKSQSTLRHQSILRDRKSYQDQQDMHHPYGDDNDDDKSNSGSQSRVLNWRLYSRSNRSEKMSARIEQLTTLNTLQNSNYDTAKSSSRQISFLQRQQQKSNQRNGQGYQTIEVLAQGQVCNLPMKQKIPNNQNNTNNRIQIINNSTLPDFNSISTTIIPDKDITTIISRYGVDQHQDAEKYYSQQTQKSNERLTSQGTLEAIKFQTISTGKAATHGTDKSSYHNNISAIGQILRKNRGMQEYKGLVNNRQQYCLGQTLRDNDNIKIDQQIKEEQSKYNDQPLDQNQFQVGQQPNDDMGNSIINQPERSQSPIPRSYTPTQLQKNAKSPLNNYYKPTSPTFLSALNCIQGQDRNNICSNNTNKNSNSINRDQQPRKNVSYDIEYAEDKRQQKQHHQATKFSRAQIIISRQHQKDLISKKAGLSSEERMEDTFNRSKCSTMVNTNGHWTKGAQVSGSLAKGSQLSTSLPKGSVGSTSIWQSQMNQNKEEIDSERGNMVSENEEDVIGKEDKNIQNKGDCACVLDDSLSCYFLNDGGKGNSMNLEEYKNKSKDDNDGVSQEKDNECGGRDQESKQRQLKDRKDQEKRRRQQIEIQFDMGEEVSELIQNNMNERDVITERNESGFSSSQGNNLIEEPIGGTDVDDDEDGVDGHVNYGTDSPQLLSRASKFIPTVIQQNRKRRDVYMEDDTINLESEYQQYQCPEKPIVLEQLLFRRKKISNNPLKQSIRYESIPQ